MLYLFFAWLISFVPSIVTKIYQLDKSIANDDETLLHEQRSYLEDLRTTSNYPLLRIANKYLSIATAVSLFFLGLKFVVDGRRLENWDLQEWGIILMVLGPMGAAFEFGIVRMLIDLVDGILQRSRRQD